MNRTTYSVSNRTWCKISRPVVVGGAAVIASLIVAAPGTTAWSVPVDDVVPQTSTVDAIPRCFMGQHNWPIAMEPFPCRTTPKG